MENGFETREEFFKFVEKFCEEELPKPDPEDTVLDEDNGDYFLKWEGHRFVINLKLEVNEEIKDIMGEEEIEYPFKTPLAKAIQSSLKLYFEKQKSVFN